MAFERKCIVDLKDYRYCNHCNEFNPMETWRFLFCCENCRDIYHTVDDYNANKITANEAKERLEKYDLSGLDRFHPFVKRDIDRIFDEAVDEIQEEITETIHIDDNSSISVSADDDTNSTVTVVKPRGLRRKTPIIEEKIDE